MKINESKMPTIITEWIDEDVLPDLADGYHTPEQIYDEIQPKCFERLLKEMNGEPYKIPDGYQPLIDAWMVIPTHKFLFKEYVQMAFDSWEGGVDDTEV